MMQKKEKLFISTLVENPAVSYPAYYMLTPKLYHNERLHASLIALHQFEFDGYTTPESFEKLFEMLHSGGFPLYLEKYLIGYFGNKMMYLTPQGWKALPVTEQLFEPTSWLIA